ncbi:MULTISPECIES: enoyl-CoA hydratase [Lysinibacillus]|uniref:Enoyl-CoA hydratase n=1 Tax=Lysinibacillus antri TaxID=2498145 RepID=A0A432LFL1_9BACI|nr:MULTISPECIES: enoyl-CoA hydratase [Lysinibacillus]RUL56369.1 enoyl-CoA hydratase [Lysinibacillus antri]TSI07043.1 enoyl-CoA hydratase [Lysinibacillus sp. BW-2-10]
MAYETIKVDIADRRATLTFNRPDVANTMNLLMMQELADCFEFLKENPEVQILVIKGEGKIFSAGGDIKMMLTSGDPVDFEIVMSYLTRMVLALYQLPMVTIAQIKGAAAGLGFSIALGCDVLVAEENSKLAMNFIGVGLVPDGGGHFFLKERVGIPKAKQMIWQGNIMDPNEALKHGLIDQVVVEGELDSTVDQIVGKFLASPILAVLETKSILHEQKLPELKNILKMEAEAQKRMRKTEDHLEGIKAFIEKRTQQFKGK